MTGEIFVSGAGRFCRMFIASTPGWVADDAAPTIGDVAGHWDEVTAEAGYTVPSNLEDWATTFMSHRRCAARRERPVRTAATVRRSP